MLWGRRIEGLPITLDCTSRICGAAFDGHHYYFLPCRERKIVKAGMNLEEVHTECPCKKFDCICYDLDKDCFWASGRLCGNRIYKLDCRMRELDYLYMEGCPWEAYPITGLSLDCCTGKLAVSAGNSLYELDKRTGRCHALYTSRGNITGVLRLCPGYLITTAEPEGQRLTILDSCGVPLKRYRVHPDFIVKGILFNPCLCQCYIPSLEFLTLKKECYSYLYRIPLEQFSLCYKPCDCNYRICRRCPRPEF